MASIGNQVASAQKENALAKSEILRLKQRIAENERFIRQAQGAQS